MLRFYNTVYLSTNFEIRYFLIFNSYRSINRIFLFTFQLLPKVALIEIDVAYVNNMWQLSLKCFAEFYVYVRKNFEFQSTSVFFSNMLYLMT